MKRNILIGGAWPYANNSLHIGHLAALLPGDVLARYFRGKHDEVIYVSGTDSHGTPITERAKVEKVNPEDIAKKYHEEFTKNFKDLDFSYDLYTATFKSYHKEKVKRYFLKMYENGYIFEKEEDQDYCDTCKTFLSDREIVGICPHCGGEARGDQCENCLTSLEPKDIKDKHCKTCGGKTTLKKNKHLYFKLPEFKDKLTDFVLENGKNWRKNAINESKKYLSQNMPNRAATRQLTWGVEVPIKGYEDKRIYVWIEAVLGYLTACEKVCEERHIDFKEFVKKSDHFKSYYVHGKDNIPFHTIIFPALLMAIDEDMGLPNEIISSEYMNMNDEKMSKSKGNMITIQDLLDEFDKDSIRYYMIANGPEKKDANFNHDDFINIHNKFLVGVLGNFVNRNLSFVYKKLDGVIKKGKIDDDIKAKTISLYQNVSSLIEKGELKLALEKCMEYCILGNKYYDDNTPWIKVKEDINAFNDVTYTCTYMIANIANLFYPFIPSTCLKIKEMLSLNEYQFEEEVIDSDIKINNVDILFQKLEK